MIINPADSNSDIIFVCGIYKSGTSLITDKIEKSGFYNPASENNKYEHGNGLSQLYLTKECTVTRNINREILSSFRVSNFNKILSPTHLKLNFIENLFDRLKSIISELPPNTVIKDPLFTYTLYHWIEAGKVLDKKMKIYFTDRPKDELATAWNEAYFTTSLLNRNFHAMENMLKMQSIQESLCQGHISAQKYSLSELKNNSNA